MAERLIQLPPAISKQEINEEKPFITEMVHISIGAFDAYFSVVPIRIKSEGYETSPVKANNLKTFLTPEEYDYFTARVASETTRSLAKTLVHDTAIDQEHLSYDEKMKIKAPISRNDLVAKQTATLEVIEQFKKSLREKGVPEEDITQRFSSQTVSAEEYKNWLRNKWKDNDSVDEKIEKEMQKKENSRLELVSGYATHLIEERKLPAHAVVNLIQPEHIDINDYRVWLEKQEKPTGVIESNIDRIQNKFIIPPAALPEEVRKQIREAGQQYVSKEQRTGYMDNARRTIKNVMVGPGPNGELLAEYDQDAQEMVVHVLTGKRPYYAYALYASIPLTEHHATEKRNLARILGTVMSLRTRDGKRIITKRSDDNEYYKSLGFRGGLADLQPGYPELSNDVIQTNNSEETYHESGIPPKLLIERRITTLGYDNFEDHNEAGEAAIIDMDAEDVIKLMLHLGEKEGEERVNEFPELSFFVMDDSSKALTDVLTKVHSGFPPTHVLTALGDVYVMRYQERLAYYKENPPQNMSAEQAAYEDANKYLYDIAPQVQKNYDETDVIAANTWIKDPNAWQNFLQWEKEEAERKGKKPRQRSSEPPTKYDPSIPDRFQGIFPKAETEKNVRSKSKIEFHGPDFGPDFREAA